MTGALILATFALFAVLMYARALPALLALPLMAVTMALVAGVPPSHLGEIVTDGSASLAKVYAAVIFGALLGRVTLDTGIARALVNLAAEYGGENPFALAMVVCAIVALLFTSLSGLGAIVMVGSVALPILMTVGVPRAIASTLFLMAFALGFIFNIANWTFYTQFFGVTVGQITHYALVLAAIDAVALVAYAAIAFRRERDYATWAVRADPDDEDVRGVGPWALIAPVLPLLLYYALHVDAVPAFAIAAVYGALATRPRDAVRTLVAAAIRGVEDVAPAVLLFMGIGMLLVATKEPAFAAALTPMVGGAWMRSPLAFVAVFGLASPLALYRGPLNPFGVGIAIFTVLLSSHAIPPIVLVAAVMAVVQVQNVCDPTNTANVWVANFTGTPIDTITKRTLPYQVAVATVACLAIVLASPALFGGSPFLAWAAPAYAADTLAGTLAPPGAADRLAVDDDGTPLGRIAADEIAAALDVGNVRTIRLHDDPNASDCTHKRYAAYALASTSTFALIQGIDFDVGIRLEDCGGWIVDEWHDHRVVAQPDAAEARRLALEGARRVLAWEASEPERAATLFARGIALAPSDPPSYFYALFKTVDGYMRVYVRAGGPAYDAGLRSGDIVDKVDGRFWWEYGTYQTQARAYDGKPHSFDILRPGGDEHVQLGAPLDPQAVAAQPAAKPSP